MKLCACERQFEPVNKNIHEEWDLSVGAAAFTRVDRHAGMEEVVVGFGSVKHWLR